MKLSRRHLDYILNKISKVTSDEPAYKEKKKTDTGYVWVYDDKHIEKRWKEKKEKLKRLNKSIEKLRKAYEKDLSSDDLRTRALAAIVGIMDDTAMRVGNEDSAKEADTYGATTLKVKHLKLGDGKATFKFVGKDHVKQDVFTSNKKIVSVLRELIKGKKDNDFIFEIDGTKIWDRAVNRYLAPFEISAKDIRGFQANKLMEEVLKKKDWKEALDEVAELVGHKASTLKNQYLDPDLVHKHDKKKEASLSIRADNNMSEAPEPVPSGQVPMVNVNKNISNIHPNAQSGMNPRLRAAWSIIAPFLPNGARLRSSTRSEMGQKNIIKNYWANTIWKTSGGRRVPVSVPNGEGFFIKNFPQVASIDPSTDIAQVPEAELEKARQFMTSQYDYRAKVNYKGNDVSVWKLGGPWTKLYIAGGGQSKHIAGKAIDIDNVPLSEIVRVVEFMRKDPTISKHLVIGNVYQETDQDNVHIDVMAAKPMRQEHLEALLRNFYYNYPLASMVKSQSTTSLLSKRALLDDREKVWFDQQKMKLQSPVEKADEMNAGGLKTNDLIDGVWNQLSPHIAPLGGKMTSAIRTPEDQIRVIQNYWNMSGAAKKYPGLQDPGEMAKVLRFMGYTINDPDKTPHSSGRSFDVGGQDLEGIADKIKEVSNKGLVPAKLNVLIEPKNRAVHVDIVNASDDTNEISKLAAKINMDKQIRDIYEDLAQSGAPAEIVNEYKTTFNLLDVEQVDDRKDSSKKASLSIRAEEEGGDKPQVNIPEEQKFQGGFGKDDMMGDWFEKSPEFRHKEIPEESAELSEADAGKLANDDPERFFYRGLHKQYPNLEIEALKNMLKGNAKFYFVFKYNEREEAFKALLQSAAEALSQQDARAFFYYYLHQKFPELGRGAIIQIIDTNPDSFFDLGLDKDYPDYIESANNARNIKDPNKVELEQPEWLKNEPDQALSIRDKNAAAVWPIEESEPTRKNLTEEDARNIAEGKNPSAFFSYHDLGQKYPELEMLAVQNTATKEPAAYFLSHFHEKPKYKKFNQDAALRLLTLKPHMYFTMGLFSNDEFKGLLDGAMFQLANIDPKFFLETILPLEKFKKFHHLKTVAENALKKKSNWVISKRAEAQAFPKVCALCKKSYNTPNELLAQPFQGKTSSSIEVSLDDPGLQCAEEEWGEIGTDWVYRDCDCGSTLIVKIPCMHKKKVEAFISKRAKAKKHSKAGIFAVVPKELAKEFPSLGNHDDSKPHVTVLFIGKVPKKQRELLEETVKNVLAEQKPFKVKLDEKVSYFPATKHSDGCKIAKLKIISDDLHKLNKDLKKAMKKAGIEVDDHFPTYKPHITLEYMPKGQEKYEKDFPKGSFTIDKVEIWNGDHKKKFKFGGGKKKLSSRNSPISKRSATIDVPKKMLNEIYSWAFPLLKPLASAHAEFEINGKKHNIKTLLEMMAGAPGNLYNYAKDQKIKINPDFDLASAIDLLHGTEKYEERKSLDDRGTLTRHYNGFFDKLKEGNLLNKSDPSDKESYNVSINDVNVDVRASKDKNGTIKGQIYKCWPGIYQASIYSRDVNLESNECDSDLMYELFSFSYDPGSNILGINIIDETSLYSNRKKFSEYIKNAVAQISSDKFNNEDFEIERFVFEPVKTIRKTGKWPEDFGWLIKNNISSYQQYLSYVDALCNTLSDYLELMQEKKSMPETVKLSGGKVSTNRISNKFKTDISDTTQYQKFKDEIDQITSSGKFSELKVTLGVSDKRKAHYVPYGNIPEIVVSLQPNDISDKSDFIETLSHELVHFMQAILTEAVKMKNKYLKDKNWRAGLPFKHDPKTYQLYTSDLEKHPEYRKQHALSDVEFYARLEDSLGRLRKKVRNPNIGYDEMSFVQQLQPKGIIEPSIYKMPKDLVSKIMKNRLEEFLKEDDTLNYLRRFDIDKFNKFVKEIYRVYEQISKAGSLSIRVS